MTAAKFILVADDNEPSREGLKLLLSRWGYSAETAVDGADALHHAVTRHPALIITDLHMPKMDGLELLQTVQASLPDIPTILVTGTHECEQTGAEAGHLAFGGRRLVGSHQARVTDRVRGQNRHQSFSLVGAAHLRQPLLER